MLSAAVARLAGEYKFSPPTNLSLYGWFLTHNKSDNLKVNVRSYYTMCLGILNFIYLMCSSSLENLFLLDKHDDSLWWTN